MRCAVNVSGWSHHCHCSDSTFPAPGTANAHTHTHTGILCVFLHETSQLVKKRPDNSLHWHLPSTHLAVPGTVRRSGPAPPWSQQAGHNVPLRHGRSGRQACDCSSPKAPGVSPTKMHGQTCNIASSAKDTRAHRFKNTHTRAHRFKNTHTHARTQHGNKEKKKSNFCISRE